MKSIIKYIIITIVCVVAASTTKMVCKVLGESEVTEFEETLLEESVEDIIYDDDYLIYLKNQFITVKRYGRLIMEINALDGKVIDDDIYIYLLVTDENQQTIYQINKSNQFVHMQILENLIINDFAFYQNQIVLIGSCNDDAYLGTYDKNLKNIQTRTWGGTGYESFTHLQVVKEDIYVSCDRDAHLQNSIFKNIGNYGERKSLVCKINSALEIVKVLYLNELMPHERVMSIHQYGSQISVLFHNGQYFQYVINENLEITNRYCLKGQYTQWINIPIKMSNPKHFAYINYSNENLELVIYQNNQLKTCLYKLQAQYIKVIEDQGKIIIYYVEEDKTQKLTIGERHTEYLKSLICTYYEYDETRTNHFLIASYFEDLQWQLDNISPIFSRRMNGEYEATYIAKRANGDIYNISTPLIVEDYLNIVEGGIYRKGTSLLFHGNATLNGVSIINGTSLNQEGENQLIITDANNKQKTYNFVVVSDYYKENDHQNIKVDFETSCNELILIPLNTSNNQVINSLTVNQEIIDSIVTIDNINYLELISSDIPKLTHYEISEYTFSDNGLIITKPYQTSFVVRTVKKQPEINILENSNFKHDKKLTNIDVQINDQYQSASNLRIELWQNDRQINIENTYLKNTKVSLTGYDKNQPITIKVLLECAMSPTIKQDYLLFTYTGIYQNNILELGQIDFVIQDAKLTQIQMLFDFSSGDFRHEKIMIGQNETINLAQKYQTSPNHFWLITSIILSIVIIIIFAICIIVKKRKRQTQIS